MTLADMLDHRESDSGRRTSSAVVWCQLEGGGVGIPPFVVSPPLSENVLESARVQTLRVSFPLH